MKFNTPDFLMNTLMKLMHMGNPPEAILTTATALMFTELIFTKLETGVTEAKLKESSDRIEVAAKNLVDTYIPWRCKDPIDSKLILISAIIYSLSGAVPVFKVKNGVGIMEIDGKSAPLSREMDATGSAGTLDDILKDITDKFQFGDDEE